MKEFTPITDFGDAWFDLTNFDPSSGIQNGKIREVAEIFKEQIHAAHSIVSLNLVLVAGALRIHKAWSFAEETVSGGVAEGSPEHEEFKAAVARFLSDFRFADIEDGTHKILTESASFFHTVSQVGGYNKGPEIRSILQNMIVRGWTAFETMCGDLWETALNEHPGSLSILAGSTNKHVSKEDRMSRDEVASMKTVKLSELAKHKYDLTNCMGSILKEKCKFTSLDGIRDAYDLAFALDEKETSVREVLQSPGLDELSILRNVIVHRSARADDDFKWKRNRILASSPLMQTYRELERGDPVDITGAQTSQLLVATHDVGTRLIKAVDDWIHSH